MKWAFCIKFDRQVMNEVFKGFNMTGVVQVGDGSRIG
jgi:hypothetical protein